MIERILQEAEAALRPFVTAEDGGVSFASRAALATARR